MTPRHPTPDGSGERDAPVERVPGKRCGKLCITGTRIDLLTILGWPQTMTPAEIAAQYYGVSCGMVEDALAWARANRDEVKRDVAQHMRGYLERADDLVEIAEFGVRFGFTEDEFAELCGDLVRDIWREAANAQRGPGGGR